MKYKDYDIANFIADEFFIQWVKNPDENNQHFWEKWISEHPEKRPMVTEAANLIRSVKYSNSPEFTNKMYIETFEHILRADQPVRQKRPVNPSIKAPTKKRDFFSGFPIRGIAASLLVLFCIWVQYEAVKYRPEPVEIPAIPMITRSNPAGLKSIIEMSDGTKIHLNSESEIEFPQEFSSDFRFVSLKGEAFFDVKKEQRPFLVKTVNTEIHVLGTSFNVNKMNNGSLHVALVTGKVSVNTKNGSQMKLDPNEMLILEEGGGFQKTKFDPREVLGWKDKFLVFKSTDINEVKRKLEKWYGVNVELRGDFDKNWTYSGVYENEIIDNVLRGISTTSGMTYKIDNKKITITSPK